MKNVNFASFFRNISKMAKTILKEKNSAKSCRFGLQTNPNEYTSKKIIFYEILIILSKCMLLRYQILCTS